MSSNDLQWTSKLELGVTEMDNEHKELVDRINHLADALETDDMGKVKIKFESLGEYVVKHFKDEEEFMESFGFEGLATHKKIHENLLNRVGDFGKQVEAGSVNKGELMDFLKLWLTSHILGIDTKYAEVYKTKKAA